jgi:hypothetical protein
MVTFQSICRALVRICPRQRYSAASIDYHSQVSEILFASDARGNQSGRPQAKVVQLRQVLRCNQRIEKVEGDVVEIPAEAHHGIGHALVAEDEPATTPTYSFHGLGAVLFSVMPNTAVQ